MSQPTSSTRSRAGNATVQGVIVAGASTALVSAGVEAEQVATIWSPFIFAVLSIATKLLRNVAKDTQWEHLLS